MNRRNLLSRGIAAALALVVPSVPASAQKQPKLSRKAVTDDPIAPKLAGASYDVTIVEFFDYNCSYCRRMEPVLNALLNSDRNVRIVYRDCRSSVPLRAKCPGRRSRANGRTATPRFMRRC